MIGSSQPLPSDGRYAFIDHGLPWRSPRICFGSKGNKEDKRQEGQGTGQESELRRAQGEGILLDAAIWW